MAQVLEHELERDTTLTQIDEDRFAGRISDAWGIYGNPHGGYLAVWATRALLRVLPHPDPFSVTTHYLLPPKPGDAEVRVQVLRVGRSHSFGVARLWQDGKERAYTTGVFGDLSAIEGPTREEAAPLPLPPIGTCEPRIGPPGGSTFGQRMEGRYAPDTVAFLDGKTGGPMQLGGYLRFADGREPDALSLILIADAMPPPALHAIEKRAWVPTIELTVHVRRRPRPGWIAAWFRTRFLIDGYLEEDGELYDSDGRLVALSRQLARVQRA